MKKIEAIIRPDKLQDVIAALRETGVTGFTVVQAQGRGQQKNTSGVYRGHVYSINLHAKLKIEIVLSEDFVQPAIKAIIEAGQTGETGDGKIFVYPVVEAYNIRTGKTDETIDELNG